MILKENAVVIGKVRKSNIFFSKMGEPFREMLLTWLKNITEVSIGESVEENLLYESCGRKSLHIISLIYEISYPGKGKT